MASEIFAGYVVRKDLARRFKGRLPPLATPRTVGCARAGNGQPEHYQGTLAGQQCSGMNGLLWLEGAVKRDPIIDVWLNEQAPELGAIARKWFVQMRACGDDVRELMHDGCPVACVGDVPFGYVNVFKAHVNVGFFLGAELQDPAGLLEGSGKRMRHVKVRPNANLNVAALSALIDAAYTDITSRLSTE